MAKSLSTWVIEYSTEKVLAITNEDRHIIYVVVHDSLNQWLFLLFFIFLFQFSVLFSSEPKWWNSDNKLANDKNNLIDTVKSCAIVLLERHMKQTETCKTKRKCTNIAVCCCTVSCIELRVSDSNFGVVA